MSTSSPGLGPLRCRAAYHLLPLALFLGGCPAELDAICGVPTTAPDVPDGRGTAQQDGASFDEQASWSPGSNASITIGDLDMIVAVDETGTSFDQLLEDGALPFCVPLGERSEKSGSANLVSRGLVSDATHTGGVAVLAKEGDILVGRFAVDVAGGGETVSFTEGQFRAKRR